MSATIKADHSLPPSTTWPCVQAFENDPPSRHGAHRPTNPERGRMRDEYPGNCAASAIQTQKNAAKKQLRENLVVIVACCLQASRNKSFCPASEQRDLCTKPQESALRICDNRFKHYPHHTTPWRRRNGLEKPHATQFGGWHVDRS